MILCSPKTQNTRLLYQLNSFTGMAQETLHTYFMDPYNQFYSHYLSHSFDPKCLLWVQVVKIYSLGGVGSPAEYIELFGGGGT